MSTATANKLKIKDIITVVLLALINVVIFFASSVLYATPITIILMPVFFALLEGIVKLYRGGVEVLDKERLNRIARGEA